MDVVVAYDTADFIAAEMCCACGGGATANQGDGDDTGDTGDGDGGDTGEPEPVEPECENTDNGASDSYGDTCASWYDANESVGSYGCSGAYDTADFIAAEMCCACGGGTDYVAPEPTVDVPGACNVDPSRSIKFSCRFNR